MNDTHRSTPAFDSMASQRIGDRTGNAVADALRTRTTGADSARESSAVTLWREVDALGGSAQGVWDEGWNEAVRFVLAILERRGFTEHADSLVEPTALSIDDRASIDRVHDRLFDPERWQGWTDRGRAWLAAGAPLGEAFGVWPTPGGGVTVDDPRAEDEAVARAVREAVEYGALSGMRRATSRAVEGVLDPTPEEQRARFEAIAGTPRPTAAEIKSALETIAEYAEKIRRWTPLAVSQPRWIPDPNQGATMSHNLETIAIMLDRLGVEVVNLDMVVDDQQRQLATIARNAQPVDGTDLAELVQRAARTAETAERSPEVADRRIMAPLLRSLVGAVNDQVRRLREAEQLIADCRPVVRLVNDWATWSDSSLYAYADAILRKVLPHAPARDAIVDALAEIRKVARGRLGDDGYTVPPTYDDNQREAASTALRRIAVRGDVANPNSYAGTWTDGERYGDTVDTIARTLGMRRGNR